MVDEIDKKILSMLSKKSDITQKEIAEKLDITPPAVNSRLQRLKHKKVLLGMTPVLDLHQLGYDVTVVIKARAERGRLEAVASKWAKASNVSALYRISGDYDLVLIAKFHNTKELDEFNQKMFSDELIARTNTSLVFSTKKEGMGPNEIK